MKKKQPISRFKGQRDFFATTLTVKTLQMKIAKLGRLGGHSEQIAAYVKELQFRKNPGAFSGQNERDFSWFSFSS
jgi:hypothetical protein